MKTKQAWVIGNRVAVGFMRDLLVITKISSPGNFRPDGYVLGKGCPVTQLYAFVPHNGGITKVSSITEAEEVIRA